MKSDPSPLQKLRAALIAGAISPRELAEQSLANANQNAGRNVYIALDKNWTLAEADRVQTEFSAPKLSPEKVLPSVSPVENKRPLFGLPFYLKVCFALKGFRPTTQS